MLLFNRNPQPVCVIKRTFSDKCEKRVIQIFRTETTRSKQQTVVTLVYLWILLEHTSVEDWYYSAASLSPADKTLNPKLSFSSDHVNFTGNFTHPARNFWLQDEISNSLYSYSTILTMTLFSQRRLWRQKGVRFSKVNFLTVTTKQTKYYRTCQVVIWRCVRLRHARLILKYAL